MVRRSRDDLLSIGELSARSGVATSALRFYETEGLLRSERTAGGHRQYPRHALRRVAFILIAQRMGLSLQEIGAALAVVPPDRAPTAREWDRMSRAWRARLDEQIETLQHLRDDLSSCIGCGCLSLRTCALYNPQDAATVLGTGPRYLLGDEPEDAAGTVARNRAPSAGF